MANSKSIDVYEIVRDRILTQLEEGVVPWRRPWGTASTTPVNAISKRPYRGINLFLLPVERYQDNRWVTFKQAQGLGGSVRKGEKSSSVVFWKMLPARNDSEGVTVADHQNGSGADERRVVPFLRYYNVFNVEQCDGLNLPARETVPAVEPDAAADAIIAGMPNRPAIVHGNGDRAFYAPGADSITMPARSTFPTAGGYYSTIFHELTHSTGHKSRTDRHADLANFAFGCEDYGKEELVAEFGAAFLGALAGIDTDATLVNSAAYIASWQRAIKNADRRLLISAASKATKAVSYITGPVATSEDEED